MISTASLPTNSDHKDSAPQAPSKTAEFVQDKDENVDLLNGQPHCSVTKLDKWNLMKVRVGFDVTRKGERSLVIDGYKFTKSRDGMSDRVFWRCSRRECKATAVTVGGRVEHVRILHTHKPPTPGEFFSSAAATTTTTEATTQLDTLGRSNSASRVKRRSHRQQQLQPQTAKSVSEMGGKDSNSDTSAVAAILSDFVEQRQAEKKLEEPNNDHQNVQGNGFLVTSQHHTPQLLSATTFSHDSAQKYPPFTEIDNRGLSALADAAAHQSKRDSQNSTPDPPCEAPGASPSPRQATPLAHLSSPLPSERGISATTALSGQLVLLGPRGLSAPSLLVGSSSDVPFFSTPSYLSSCTRRFSVSEMPISARTNLQKSLFQTDSSVTRSPIAPISVANSMEPPNRGPIPTMLPSNASTSSGVGMLLHWKKEKMLESKAEEEMKQHRRRRHFTGSSFAVAPPDDVPAANAPDAALVTINGEDDAPPTLSVKRKRCASAGHPFVSASSSCSLLAAAALPSAPGMNDSLTAASPQSTPGGGGTDQEPAFDWCARVQSDLLTQVFTTLQQLAARLGADYEADSVVANCRAIQACLDTISAIKRARQEVSNASRTP